MTSTQQHFGKGAETIGFPLDTKNTQGNRRTCLGGGINDGTIQWYGFIQSDGIRVDPYKLTFCQCCGEQNFQPHQVFKIMDNEYPNLIPVLICDTVNTKLCLAYNIDMRCLHYAGFRVNINLINREGDKWVPASRIPTIEAGKAAKVGTHLVNIPTHTGWECCIKGDPNGKYANSDLYYKVECARFGDGREVIVSSKGGTTNFYTPLSSPKPMIFNGYDRDDSRFVFVAPSNLEKSHGLQASHDKQSNKLYLTLSIHREVTAVEPVYRQSKGGNDEYLEGSYDMVSDANTMRGGTTKGASMNGYFSAATTRGGSVQSDYSGGSNFSSGGKTHHSETHTVNSTFPKVGPSVEMIIQLVNNEPQEDLLHFARLVQEQVEGQRRDDLGKLQREKELLEAKIHLETNRVDPRSQLFGHTTQEAHLI